MIILFNDTPGPPNRSIGIYRIATVLRKQGLKVEVIDFLSYWDFNLLIKYLDTISDVEWYGFSTKFYQPNQKSRSYLGKSNRIKNEETGVFTSLQVDNENILIQYIKNKNKKIVIGGPNADIIKHYTTNIDIICVGYGDNAVLQIHNYIVSNSNLKFELFNNIKIVDADKDYPVLDLSNLETIYDDSDFVANEEVFAIEISRGCIFHCAFCDFTHLGKKPGTYIRDKESIKKDILDRYTKYNSTKFLFVDDTFNDSIEKMNMIKEIREEIGVPFEFWSYCRLDLLAANPDQVELIEKIGWKAFTFGVETFNRESGRKVGKGADPKKLKQFLLYLRERFPNIKMQVNIIIGLPNDTEESVRETVDWFIQNSIITSNIKVNSLSIKNPDDKKFASKISTNPKKYGYTIIHKEKNKNLVWQTDFFNLNTANELALELQQKVRTELLSKEKNRNYIHSMRDESVIVVDENEVRVNLLEYQIKIYIDKKLKFRNIKD